MLIDKIFVINLKRRPDRLNTFYLNCPINKNLITVFNAFDAKNYTDESIEDQKFFNSIQLKNLGGLHRIGEKGCFISHLKIWHYIIENKIDNTLIFEDDALFSDNFLDIFNNININDFKILYLGGRFKQNFIMHNPIYITNCIVKHDTTIWNGEYHDRTTHAYIITYDMAIILIDEFNNNYDLPPVDHFIIKTLLKNNIDIFNTHPLICWSPINGDSDIR